MKGFNDGGIQLRLRQIIYRPNISKLKTAFFMPWWLWPKGYKGEKHLSDVFRIKLRMPALHRIKGSGCYWHGAKKNHGTGGLLPYHGKGGTRRSPGM